ncbi:MAG: hypothetical protein ACMUJM_20560 [bacterium]
MKSDDETRGSSAVSAAQMGAVAAQSSPNKEASTRKGHWIEFQFIDKAGHPVSGIPYMVTGSDGKVSKSTLQQDGRVKRNFPMAGQCKVTLFGVQNARWSVDEASVGEKVRLTADIEGFEEGNPALFHIFRRDIKGPDHLVATITSKTKEENIEAEWEYRYPDDGGKRARKGYSSPQYYFEAIVEGIKARSGLLYYKDYIEIELMDEDEHPLAYEEYILYFSDGSVRKGKLDGKGYKKEENCPPGYYQILFPHLPYVVRLD